MVQLCHGERIKQLLQWSFDGLVNSLLIFTQNFFSHDFNAFPLLLSNNQLLLILTHSRRQFNSSLRPTDGCYIYKTLLIIIIRRGLVGNMLGY